MMHLWKVFVGLLSVAFLASCTTGHKIKKGAILPSERVLQQPEVIDGVSLPARARVKSFSIHGYPQLSVKNIQDYNTVFCNNDKSNHSSVYAMVQKFGDPKVHYVLLSENDQYVSKINLKRSNINIKSISKKSGVFRVFNKPQCFGPKSETIAFLDNERYRSQKAYVFRKSKGEVQQVPGSWEYWGRMRKPTMVGHKMTGKNGLYRIVSHETGQLMPPLEGGSEIVGFHPEFVENEKESRSDSGVLWFAHIRQKEKTLLKAYSSAGKLLSNAPLVGVYAKSLNTYSSNYRKYRKANSFIGTTVEGKTEIYSPILPYFGDYFKVADSKNLVVASMDLEKYVSQTNAKEIALVKKLEEDKRKKTERLNKLEARAAATVRRIDAWPMPTQLRLWQEVYDMCVAENLWPPTCNKSYTETTRISENIAFAESYKNQQADKAWKARMQKEDRDWANYQKSIGNDKYGISGSSRMLHNQMLRNGYRWVRTKD